MSSSVVVVGGGYAGFKISKELDPLADVTLVEPRQSFFHNIAALRALVFPSWLERILIPYDSLLDRGSVVRDLVIDAEAGRVRLASGRELRPDVLVLTTGSRYPFPAKSDRTDNKEVVERYLKMHESLAAAHRVLVLGAGPVGVELVGEITSAWPEKEVTLVDALDDLLGGRLDTNLTAELRAQLKARGVDIRLGGAFAPLPQTAPGELKPAEMTLNDGTALTFDIWFRCFGVDPVSEYLAGTLQSARLAGGWIEVDSRLRVRGTERVFAAGDVTNASEWKMAGVAGQQASVVAANVGALLRGESPVEEYASTSPNMTIPLGPHGGAALRGGVVLGAEETVAIKSTDMYVANFAESLGVTQEPWVPAFTKS